MEKSLKRIGIHTPFVPAIVAAIFFAGCSSQDEDALFERQLIDISNEQNKKLPQMVDDATRWDSTLAGPGKNWTYLYTTVDPSIQNITSQQINDGVGEKIRNSVCTLKDMEIFVQKEVTVKYKYRNSNGKYLGEVVVTPEDCKKLNHRREQPN